MIYTQLPTTTVIAKAKALAFAGKHKEAYNLILQIQDDLNNLEFTRREESEFNLAAGIVIGFFGKSEQFPKPQATSIKFLLNARLYFEHRQDYYKLAECEAGLAAAFERLGEFEQGRKWIETALQRPLPLMSEIRLYAILIDTIFDFYDKKYSLVIEKLLPLSDSFQHCKSSFLKAFYNNQLGIAYLEIDLPQSSTHLSKACSLYQEINHPVYLASVLNNFAFVLKKQGRFIEAFSSASRSRKISRKLGNQLRETSTIDTLAGILFERKLYKTAKKYIEVAIKRLDVLEKKDYLFEALQTKIKICSALGQIHEVLAACIRADNLSNEIFETKPDVMAFTADALEKYHLAPLRAKNKINQIMYAPFANDQFTGILFRNNNLQKFGFEKGSFAVLEQCSFESIKTSDLIAVLDKETNEIVCGFFSEFARLVSISVEDHDFIYDFSGIEILGRVVGRVRNLSAERPIVEKITSLAR